MIAHRVAFRSPPVDKSITVSAPHRSAHCSFSTSSSVRMTNRRCAHVGVDLGERRPADAHRLELVLQVNFVGRDDHPARRRLRRGSARPSDAARARRRGSSRRDHAAARSFELRFAVAVAILRAKSIAVRSETPGIPGVSGELYVYGVPTPAERERAGRRALLFAGRVIPHLRKTRQNNPCPPGSAT